MLNLWDLLIKARTVAWPLGACSVLALAIVIERLVMLWLIQQKEEAAFSSIQAGLSAAGEYREPSAEIAGAPITQVMNTLTTLRVASEEGLWQAAEIAVSLQRMRMRRWLNVLATVGSVAPFIGLFGTVLGVMHSFDTMRNGGLSSEKITGDIAEALSATALGLLVAIPSVIAYNLFLGRIQGMLLEVQSHVSRLIPLMRPSAERQRQEV